MLRRRIHIDPRDIVVMLDGGPAGVITHYLLAIKNNQPGLHTEVAAACADAEKGTFTPEAQRRYETCEPNGVSAWGRAVLASVNGYPNLWPGPAQPDPSAGGTHRPAGLHRALGALLDLDPRPEDRHPWIGFRPMTPDGLPIVDWSTKYENLLLACGHNKIGMTLGPATGELVARRITGTPASPDDAALALNRFV